MLIHFLCLIPLDLTIKLNFNIYQKDPIFYYTAVIFITSEMDYMNNYIHVCLFLEKKRRERKFYKDRQMPYPASKGTRHYCPFFFFVKAIINDPFPSRKKKAKEKIRTKL